MSLNDDVITGSHVTSDENGGDGPTYDLRFPVGSTHLVCGPSASGKTTRVCAILADRAALIENADRGIGRVVFAYAAWQRQYDVLRRSGLVTDWLDRMPTAAETKREHLERMLVFLQTLKELRPKHRIILLSHVDPTSHDCVCEAISNPTNMGVILRCAAALHDLERRLCLPFLDRLFERLEEEHAETHR